MMLRNAGRMAVAGVLAAGALSLVATPAYAADVDFGVDVAGSVIASDAPGKEPTVEITNHGATTPASIVVRFDATGLDPSKVTLAATAVGRDCESENGFVSCVLEERDVPAPGRFTRVRLPLLKVAGATGAAGKLTVTVKAEGDTVPTNDSRTVDVAIGDNGVDLAVVAADVTWQNENGTITDEPVPPGAVAPLFVLIANQGDMTAAGVRVQVRLPEQTTFTERHYTGCVISGDRRAADCELTQFSLRPARKPGQMTPYDAMFFRFEVRVLETANGPVALKDGSATAAAIEQVESSAAQRSAPVEPLDYMSWPPNAKVAEIDVDLADNSDEFVVFVGAGAGGGDGGDGDGGQGDGGQDDGDEGQGGGLPVTGPATFAVAGAGLAAVTAGLVLLLVSRRRRVRL